jgi:nitrile hydratase accessory protein
MATLAEQIAADTKSPAAIPRRNGEPLFNEPWESRAFGMTVGLCERGFFAWDEFRARLIEAVSSADQRHEHSSYYERFLGALEQLMLEKQLCVRSEIDQRAMAEARGA